MNYEFYLYAIGFGISLAMDAFSVSLANGLHEPGMRLRRMCAIAGIFALFQGLMPLLGWICVHTVVSYFSFFEALIPWISLGLLGYIGGKMLYDSIRGCGEEGDCGSLTVTALLLQAIATSIDALSTGFAISEYDLPAAILTAAIISVLTFIICLCGVYIGKKSGTRLAGKAGMIGGIILIAIGLEIFITGLL
jgi:putative Mn2+ efflux pump MntP